jgi:predicted amidophosphoribosyltransferase
MASSSAPNPPGNKCFACDAKTDQIYCETCRNKLDKNISTRSMDDTGNKKNSPII